MSYTAGADGSLQASDIEYAEQELRGILMGVTGTTVTVEDPASGGSKTLHAYSGGDVGGRASAFVGVSGGDTVDVTYHARSGQLIVDTLDDGGVPADGGSVPAGY